jgi:hypothetical protein
MRAIASLIVAGLLTAGAPARAGDFQTWHTVSLKWLDTKYVDLTTAVHVRFTDDSSDFSLYRIGQEASADLLAWLQAGLGYRYTESKNAAGEFRYQHRGEIELTPRAKLSDRLGVSFRNRLELIGNEGDANLNERTRHRLQLQWRTPQWEPLAAVFVSNELFYDFDRNKVSENRVIPAGLSFRLTDKARLSIHYMLRSVRGAEHWRHDHVLGTGLSLSL